MPRSKSALPYRSSLAVRGSAVLPVSFGVVAWKIRAMATRCRNCALLVTGRLPVNLLRVMIYRHVFRMKIAKGARIEPGCVIWGPSRITIGEGTIINREVILDGRFPLTI